MAECDEKKKNRAVGERLKKAVKLTGLSQGKFAESLGITRTGMSGVFGGQSRLTLSMALAIENLYKINHRWVMHGEGGIWKDELDRLQIKHRMILDLAPDRPDLERKWWERKLGLPRKKQEVASQIIYWMEENTLEGVEVIRSRSQTDSMKFSQKEQNLRVHRLACWNSARTNGSLVNKDDFYMALLLILWSEQKLEEIEESDDLLQQILGDQEALVWLNIAAREIEADLREINRLFSPEIFARPYLNYQIPKLPIATNSEEVLKKLSPAQISRFWMELGSAEDLFELVYTYAA